MALQGKVLNRLCRSMWRMNVTGSGAQVDTVLQSSTSRHGLQRHHHHHHHHHLSHLFPSAALPASLHLSPPYLHATNDVHSSKDAVAVHTKSSSNLQKEADTLILSSAVLKNRSHIITEANNVNILTTTTTTITPLGLRIWDVNQTGRRQGLSLASWPDAQHMEYSCPSEKLTSLPELTFLDPAPLTAPCELPQSSTTTTIFPIIIHDPNPTTATTTEICDPMETDPRNAPKEARKIMKIRRKKMKRHLLKKFRKRMAFTLRKIKRERRKKKEAVFQARLNTIQEWGDNFDARQWVTEQLDKARRGGFYINVLQKQSGSNP